jgi:hypothetical protein
VNAATDLRPEVAAFLSRVREQLSDLTEEEREELLDGLEADLSEQVAAGDALPDPVSYAGELRAAAGLAAGRAGRPRRPLRLHLRAGTILDRARARWLSLVGRHEVTRRTWAVAELLRPAWWVLRAWIAVTLVDQLLGPWEYVSLWPTLGAPLVGPLLLVAAVVVSVLIGQGRLWPGSGPDRTMVARVVLLALNALALVAPLTFSGDGSQVAAYAGPSGYNAGYHDGTHRPGLRHGTAVVRNIYAYDAAGQPLHGVQLYDQEGRPVSVAPESSMGRGREREVTCPWFNGSTPLYNVFPLAQPTQPHGTCLRPADPARVGPQQFREPPLASVPPVTAPTTAP